MKELDIRGDRTYKMLIAPGLLPEAGKYISQTLGGSRAFVLTDSTVAALPSMPLATIYRSLTEAGYQVSTCQLPAGESSKNPTAYLDVVSMMADRGLQPTDILVALGGGMIGDIGGFAAATYMRGIKCVQVPTTFLAAVDSSVGGKTDIDLPQGKNLIGAFWEPSLVLCDPERLLSLPASVFMDGCAETIKYGILKDPEIISLLRQALEKTAERFAKTGDLANTCGHADETSGLVAFCADGLGARDSGKPDADAGSDDVTELLSQVIARAVTTKEFYVHGDVTDKGKRGFLNLGHLLGHAIEAWSCFSLSHGQSVAMGMVLEAMGCARLGLTSPETAEEIRDLIHGFGFAIDPPCTVQEILPYLVHDKRIRNNSIGLIVPDSIGSCHMEPYPADELEKFARLGFGEQ